MYCDAHIAEVLLTEAQIATRVRELAQQITADYRDRDLLLIGVLTGSFVFLADLMRQLDRPCAVDFFHCSSYGDGTVFRGEVAVLKDVTVPLHGKDVLLVEDIVDTGRTVAALARLLQETQARSVLICALLSKPARRELPVTLDYIGFEVPDRFIVGYGLDYAGGFRNLPFICALREDS